MAKKITFLAGPTRVIPSGQDRPTLPARVANQDTGFASACPLADSVSDTGVLCNSRTHATE